MCQSLKTEFDRKSEQCVKQHICNNEKAFSEGAFRAIKPGVTNLIYKGSLQLQVFIPTEQQLI